MSFWNKFFGLKEEPDYALDLPTRVPGTCVTEQEFLDEIRGLRSSDHVLKIWLDNAKFFREEMNRQNPNAHIVHMFDALTMELVKRAEEMPRFGYAETEIQKMQDALDAMNTIRASHEVLPMPEDLGSARHATLSREKSRRAG